MSQNHTTNAAAIMRKNRVRLGPIQTQRVKNVTADTRRRSTGLGGRLGHDEASKRARVRMTSNGDHLPPLAVA